MLSRMSGGRIRLLGAGLVVGAVVVGAVVLVRPGAADSNMDAGMPASSSAACGQFQLELNLSRTTWHTTEAIEGSATFRYLGTGTGQWAGSGQGPVGFEYRQVDGKIDIGPAWTADLVTHDIPAASPIVLSLRKSGAYSADDPLAGFYASFFADPQVHLPAGDWELSAATDHGCTDMSAGAALRASVRIRVMP
jgi:hypothetical protein